MICNYCQSDDFFIKTQGDKNGLYCRNCGRWLKWLDPAEKVAVERDLRKKKNEIRIDGENLDLVKEKLKRYKEKYNKLNEEIQFIKKNLNGNSRLQKENLYEKALKLKETTNKIDAYNEVLRTLNLK